MPVPCKFSVSSVPPEVMRVCVQASGEEASEEGEGAREKAREGGEEGGCEEVRVPSLLAVYCRQSTELESVALYESPTQFKESARAHSYYSISTGVYNCVHP